MQDKSESKSIIQEVDEIIIHTCHLLQNTKNSDGMLAEYGCVVRALADLVEARAHLDTKEMQPLYVPYQDTGKE